MTKVACRSCGELYKDGPFQLRDFTEEERTCQCGGRRVLPSELKPRKPLRKVSEKRQAEEQATGKRRPPLKRTARRETAAEKKARLHFNKTVKSWPCWFAEHRPCERCEGAGEVPVPMHLSGGYYGDRYAACSTCEGSGKHHCTYPKDSHHLIPKSFIRQRFQAVLADDEFVAILHNPKLGAPLCRKAHDAIEAGNDRIYFEDLSDECLEYVGSLPDFMLIRLEMESPKRQPNRTEAIDA